MRPGLCGIHGRFFQFVLRKKENDAMATLFYHEGERLQTGTLAHKSSNDLQHPRPYPNANDLLQGRWIIRRDLLPALPDLSLHGRNFKIRESYENLHVSIREGILKAAGGPHGLFIYLLDAGAPVP